MTAASESVLTLDELACFLKLSKSTLYKLVQRGEVPGVKIGKHWRFRKATIDQWLTRNEKPKKLNSKK